MPFSLIFKVNLSMIARTRWLFKPCQPGPNAGGGPGFSCSGCSTAGVKAVVTGNIGPNAYQSCFSGNNPPPCRRRYRSAGSQSI